MGECCGSDGGQALGVPCQMPSEDDPEAGPLGAGWLAHMPSTKASNSHCACIACGFPSLPVLSVTTSPRSVHVQHCPLSVALHFLVCLPWFGPSDTPQRHCVAGPRHSSWLPCLRLGEVLSCQIPIVSPPSGPTPPRCFRSPALQAPLTSGRQPHSGTQQTPLCSAVLQRGDTRLQQRCGSRSPSLALLGDCHKMRC